MVTSGNSLDYTAEDMARMVQHEAAVKVRTPCLLYMLCPLCLLCMLCPLCLLHHQSCFAWIVLSLSPPVRDSCTPLRAAPPATFTGNGGGGGGLERRPLRLPRLLHQERD